MNKAFHFLFLIFFAWFGEPQKAKSILDQSPWAAANPPVSNILTGADQMDRYLPLLRGRSVAIFANQTSRVGQSSLVDTLIKKGIQIVKIFTPEHGFRGDADAGQGVENGKDAATGIPIISLYGSKLRPSAADLRDVDILVYDVQDVGVRFYTYISSMQELLETAIAYHLPLLILDRPDPNGFYVDGPVLDTAFRSFVGMQPIPVVYGMTVGEYARMLIGEKWLDQFTPDPSSPLAAHSFRLIVIPCRNYTHKSRYTLPVKPSPNLPNMQAVYLYPSLCLFEGTVISVGRGTSKPFLQFGHPDLPRGSYSFVPHSLPGARNPPLMDQTCYGFDLSDPRMLDQIAGHFSLAWLLEAYKRYPDKGGFFAGSGRFFDKLAGSDRLRNQIEAGFSESEIRKTWQPRLTRFKAIRKKYLMYPDFE